MRFLRHKRGGGKIDETSEACAHSLVDRDSVLTDKTSVFSSAIKNSRIKNSRVCGAIVEDATVENSLITGGRISWGSAVSCELVADFAEIVNSVVLGASRIVHTAYLENVLLKNLTVSGNARLINWDTEFFDGCEGYISRGEWRRPPRILRLEKGLTITESIEGFVFCGCRELEIAHWLKVGSRYGAKLGLSPDEVSQIREFLHTLL